MHIVQWTQLWIWSWKIRKIQSCEKLKCMWYYKCTQMEPATESLGSDTIFTAFSNQCRDPEKMCNYNSASQDDWLELKLFNTYTAGSVSRDARSRVHWIHKKLEVKLFEYTKSVLAESTKKNFDIPKSQPFCREADGWALCVQGTCTRYAVEVGED